MNGQHSNEQGGQGGQESHLSFLFNAANGQHNLMGYPGGGGNMGGGQGLRYGDASLEEQILQRASALRAEALMQQQQQHQQRQHQLSAALAAFQQQQLSALGLNPNLAALMQARSAEDQEALLGRAAALRELGMGGGPSGPGGVMQVGAAGGMERLQQLELGRLEELERRRQQLAALANLSGGGRPSEIPPGSEQMGQESVKSNNEPPPPKEAHRDVTANAEKSKDDLRKTPGTVIVPCRARGMPMDHNFKTAYFVISEEAKHGEDLVCSYFACRNGGVKFRYCAHCMAPVAKRNFCRRHDHGMSAKGGDGETHDEEDEASMDQSESTPHKDEPDVAASLHKDKATPKEDLRVASAKPPPKVSKEIPGSSLDVLSKAATSSFLLQSGQGKRKAPVDEEKGGEDLQDAQPEQIGEAGGPITISKKRRSMWNALLIKRPRTKDPRHLSSWLNEVLTVSDFETPIDQPDPAEPTPAPAVSGDSSGERVAAATSAVAEKPKKEADDRVPKDPTQSTPKEKKNGEKEKKKRKIESKSSEEGSAVGPGKPKKEEKDKKKSATKKNADGSEKEKKSSKKSTGKESPNSKKEPEDGFTGSFADWRDRKKEKALSKKGGSSLRK